MLDFANLVSSLPGGVAQGLIWGIMAIGVYLTYKILDIADLTVDGTMCTGGAVCVMMIINGHSVPMAVWSRPVMSPAAMPPWASRSYLSTLMA